MNDLVKKVFVTIRANTAATVTEAEIASRAAIAAVAAFLRNKRHGRHDYSADLLAKQLEKSK